MKLHDMSPAPGSNPPRFRKGRGMASGNGKTSGRGHKGQWSRSGGGVRRGFEGGQMPMARRLPKRGFTNIFAKEYATVNLRDLSRFEAGTVVDIELLLREGIVRKPGDGLRVLGKGEVTNKLTVKAKGFSESAKAKIEAAGGKTEVV